MNNYIIGISVILMTYNFSKILYGLFNDIPIKNQELNLFNLSDIKIGNNILIIGKHKTGKTTLISKILDFHNEIHTDIIISPTECLEKVYKKYNVIPYYNSSIIKDFIKNQKENINDSTISCNECFIVLDNCFLQSEYNDPNLTDLLINGYYYKTINIIAAAYPLEFSKYFKSSIDYLCIFNNTHIIYINLIYEEYFNHLLKYNDYIKLLNKYTTNYGCIIIDFKNNGKIYYF